MRSVELADRHQMGDEAPKALTGEPGVQMESRRLDLERWLSQLCEIKVDRMVGRGTNRGRDAREHRQGRAMDMTCRDKLYARMTPDNRRERVCIDEILAIHVP